jgi:GNAT superfamily N-acetyltransferase
MSHSQPQAASRYAIRPARADDLDRLIVLLLALQDHVEASNPALWRIKSQARAELQTTLNARLSEPNACAFVAEHAEAGVVGVIFGRVATNDRYVPSQVGTIDHAFVEAEHRRAGVCSRLVAELCRYFAAVGVDDLSLRYVVGNCEAAAFWTELGFEPRIITVGASRHRLEDTLRDALQA